MRIRINDRGLEITTNIGCPNRCLFCPQDKIIEAYSRRSNVTMMPTNLYKQCIDKLPTDVNVHFSGFSEPWLNKDCTDMLMYAHLRGHRIVVSTSLVGMTPEDAYIIRHVKFKRFMLHLPCREGYENIEVTPEYIETLQILLTIYVNPVIHCHGEDIHPRLKSVLKECHITPNSCCSRANNVEKGSVPTLKFVDNRKSEPFICKNGMIKNVLLPNGDVSLCCADYGLRHVLGNLLYQEYDLLFKSKEFLRVQDSMTDRKLDTLCRWCEYAIMGEWLNEWLDKKGRRVCQIPS